MMSNTVKHLATFLLGAAAGAAVVKYKTMSPKERAELLHKLKHQANGIKTDVEKGSEKMKSHMSNVMSKGMSTLSQYIGETEKNFWEMLNGSRKQGR